MTLTHWFQLRDELLFCPLLLLPPQRHRVGDQHLVVVRVGHVQVVHKDNIRILHQNLIKIQTLFQTQPEGANSIYGGRLEGWRSGHSSRRCTAMGETRSVFVVSAYEKELRCGGLYISYEAGVFRHFRPWGVWWEARAQLGGTGGWLKSRLASPPLNGQGVRKAWRGGS